MFDGIKASSGVAGAAEGATGAVRDDDDDAAARGWVVGAMIGALLALEDVAASPSVLVQKRKDAHRQRLLAGIGA